MATNPSFLLQQFFTDDGSVANSYLLDTFLSGTTTPSTTWTDAGEIGENDNPIELDAAGRATIFVDPDLLYTFRLRTPGGATVWTRDSIAGLPVTSDTQFLPLDPQDAEMESRFSLVGDAQSSLQPTPLQQVQSLIATSSATLTTSLADQAPVGTIAMWLTGTPPTKWLLLNTATASRSTYSDLFTLWGTTFGSGDGSTTFGLPLFAGRTARGLDISGSVDPDGTGRALGSTQGYAVQNITGVFGIDDRTIGFTPTGAFGIVSGFVDTGSEGSGSGRKIDFDASRVVTTATETRMANVAVHFMVKAIA